MVQETLATYPFDTPPDLDHDPEGLRLLAAAPVTRARTANGAEVWLALGYREVRQTLNDHRFSREAATGPAATAVSQAAADPRLLIGMDPPRHTRIRRLMATAFSPRMVERLQPRVQQMVDDLLDEMAGQDRPADLVHQFAEPLPIRVICELLGVPLADRAQIREWGVKLMGAAAYPVEEIMAAVGEINAYLDKLIAERRADPDDALVSALIGVNDEDGHLSAEELTGNVQLLLVAGHETTVNQLGNSVITLFQHPEQLQLLRERPELWPQAVEELLRHCKLSSAIMPRFATEDLDLGGTPVRTGDAVIPVISVANRDPDVYPDPNRFDIRRAGPAPHTALGHGPHFCLGAYLARLELRIALGSLFARFPALAPAVDLTELRWRVGLNVRSVEELPVTW
jgi:nocardicin N-oxygenase